MRLSAICLYISYPQETTIAVKRIIKMNSDLLTRWTTIITNIAVLIGLIFVGLEFRNNSKAIEAERIDSFIEGVSEHSISILENDELSRIMWQIYADPDSITGARLDRAQHALLLAHNNFRRVHMQHEAGLVPTELYEYERSAVGFSFSSDVGRNLATIFRASSLGGDVWDIIGESAEVAREFCINSENTCVARYEAGRK